MVTTIKIPVKPLAGYLSAAAEITTGKSVLPALSNILVEFDGSKIKLTNTNLTVTVVTSLPFESEFVGKLLLPAKKLSAAINNIASENFFLTIDGNTVTVAEENGTFTVQLAVCDINEAPATTVAETGDLMLDGRAFLEKIATVKHAMGKDGATAGVRVDCNGRLSVVATDGARMAVVEEPSTGAEKQMFFTIPADATAALLKLMATEKTMGLAFNDEAINMVGEITTVAIRCLSGTYPNYSGILQANQVDPDATVLIDRKMLTSAIERLSAVSGAIGTVTIKPTANGLELSVEDDTTAANTSVAAKKMPDVLPEPKSYSVGFLIAALAAGKSEELNLTLPTGAGKPLILSGAGVIEFMMPRITK